MTRIVFFVSSMEGGGAERVAALLCNAWSAAGHAVTLVATYSGRGGCSYPLDPAVEFLYLADLVGSTRRSPLTHLRRLRAMRALVRARRPGLVVSFLTPVNVATLIATRMTGVPVVVSERAYPPHLENGRFWAALRWFTYPWATRVVMQTQRGRAWLERHIPRAKPAVIANPVVCPLPGGNPRVDPADFVSPERKLVLAAGRLSPEKGFDRLLAAFKDLADEYRAWDLAIVGDGGARKLLQQRIEAHGLAGRVHLVGRAGNLGDWYARADLYVLSSRSEGFPNTLLEAMAHGVAVVSMACETGPADIVSHGETGLLVEPRDGATGLSKAMAALMEDADARRRLGRAARTATTTYAIDKISRHWLALICSADG